MRNFWVATRDQQERVEKSINARKPWQSFVEDIGIYSGGRQLVQVVQRHDLGPVSRHTDEEGLRSLYAVVPKPERGGAME